MENKAMYFKKYGFSDKRYELKVKNTLVMKLTVSNIELL